MRGFLRGERLDDTVPITEDGSVRKLHGNENAPLFASWIQRGWAGNCFLGIHQGMMLQKDLVSQCLFLAGGSLGLV